MQKDQKNYCGVWIDGHKAMIVKFGEDGMKIGMIDSEMDEAYYHDGEKIIGHFSGARHISPEKTISARKINIERKFMKQVFEEVKNNDEIYVLGPGEMRHKLKHFIEEEHKHDAHKFSPSDSCDYLREAQIVDRIKHHFKIK
jgi:stalled ribosome rescue protein Dom34